MGIKISVIFDFKSLKKLRTIRSAVISFSAYSYHGVLKPVIIIKALDTSRCFARRWGNKVFGVLKHCKKRGSFIICTVKCDRCSNVSFSFIIGVSHGQTYNIL
jgi:hypothetical protein